MKSTFDRLTFNPSFIIPKLLRENNDVLVIHIPHEATGSPLRCLCK